MVPPSHTLSKTSQISKIISFLVVDTGSICIAPPTPLKNFLPTLLRVTIKIELLSSSTTRSVKLEDELDLASTTSSLRGDLKKINSSLTAYCKTLFSSIWAPVALFY